MITLGWTTNKGWISKLIRWGLRNKSSHFVVVFDNKAVFHSNSSGPHLETMTRFLKKNRIVGVMNVPLTLEEEDQIWQSIINVWDGKLYDYKAFVYFFWRGLLNRFFNVPFPENNKFGDKNAMLCLELLPEILKSLANMGKISPGNDLLKKDFSIIPPDKSMELTQEVLHGKVTIY